MLSANKRNAVIKDDLGFLVKSCHSRVRVYVTIPQLIEGCEEYNVRDDIIHEWKKELGL